VGKKGKKEDVKKRIRGPRPDQKGSCHSRQKAPPFRGRKGKNLNESLKKKNKIKERRGYEKKGGFDSKRTLDPAKGNDSKEKRNRPRERSVLKRCIRNYKWAS